VPEKLASLLLVRYRKRIGELAHRVTRLTSCNLYTALNNNRKTDQSFATMSLRRSSRVKGLPAKIPPTHDVDTRQPPRKRQKKASATEQVATAAVAQDEADKDAMPPPTTPNTKRTRVARNAEKPSPFTPTPAAIGLMTNARTSNYSSGDIDGASPPPDRRVEAGHANANLITPGGTQVQPSYSNFEEPSPTKSTANTTGSILETACNHLLKIDPNLKPVIEKHHCRVFSPLGLAEEIDPFRSLTSGIIAQQVSGAAAKSIKNKFIALFPAEACPKGFPPPALVAQQTIPKLREAGLSQRKAEYIQGLAAQFAAGDLTASFLLEAPDEKVMAKLVAVRGLGAWSVEMFMCFALKRLDVFSTGDLGVQRGMAAYVGRDVKKLKAKGAKAGKWKYMSEKEMLEIAERFRPYRSLFMWYMWRVEEVDTAAVEDNA
jgi:DNA-3-methyladenine glycosylase II